MLPIVTEDQIRAIYRDTIGPLYRFVSRWCEGDRAVAEDITQETWLRAIRDWRTKGVPDQPISWLTTVARNLLLNQSRRRPHLSIDQVDPVALIGATDDSPIDQGVEVTAEVQLALSRLPQEQAGLIRSFHFDRRCVADLAVSLGVSERAVEGRLRRARENLRRELELFVHPNGEGR